MTMKEALIHWPGVWASNFFQSQPLSWSIVLTTFVVGGDHSIPPVFDWPQGWCAWPPATFRVGNPRLENLELLNSSAQHCHLSNQIRTVNDMYSLVWHLHIIYTNKAILSRCKFIILWCVPMKFDFVLFCFVWPSHKVTNSIYTRMACLSDKYNSLCGPNYAVPTKEKTYWLHWEFCLHTGLHPAR